MKQQILFILSLCFLLTSCIDDDEWFAMNTPPKPPKQVSGLFIVNEGNFMYDNASLSFYQPDSMKVFNHVFYGENKVPLGDVAQSMVIRDSMGYIVVNNSGKVYVLNINTFEYVGKITGLTSPRYMHFINDEKAYITDLYAKSITVVNPSTFEVTGAIDVDNHSPEFYQHPTEQMVQYDKYVFINCWSYDNQILVIDSETDELVDSIQVLKQPQSMVVDKFNKLWVLTDGGYAGNTFGHEAPGLLRIDAQTRSVEKTWRFDIADSPLELTINGNADTLYFINNHIYSMDVLSDDEPEVFIEGENSGGYSDGYFGLGIDPYTSEIYVADAVDYIQRGSVYRYKSDATPIDTFNVGISPGYFCFRK